MENTLQTIHPVQDIFDTIANVNFKGSEIVVTGLTNVSSDQLKKLEAYDFTIKRSGAGISIKIKSR